MTAQERSKEANERLITFSKLLTQSNSIPVFCVAIKEEGSLVLCSHGDFTAPEIYEILQDFVIMHKQNRLTWEPKEA